MRACVCTLTVYVWADIVTSQTREVCYKIIIFVSSQLLSVSLLLSISLVLSLLYFSLSMLFISLFFSLSFFLPSPSLSGFFLLIIPSHLKSKAANSEWISRHLTCLRIQLVTSNSFWMTPPPADPARGTARSDRGWHDATEDQRTSLATRRKRSFGSNNLETTFIFCWKCEKYQRKKLWVLCN